MIKILKITLVLGLFVGSAGCGKELDTQPQQSVLDITTIDQLQSQLYGAYSALKNVNYYGGTSGTASAWSSLGDIMGDDFIEALESLGNWRQLAEWRYPSDDGAIAGAYQAAYVVIGRANDVLRFTSRFESGSTEGAAKQIKAQALALRAHAHFDLMRCFAQSLNRNSDSLGVTYMTSINPDDPFAVLPTRNTVEECYDQFYDDLDEALALFREAGNPSKADLSIIDSNVVHCIKARAGLYNGSFSDAIQSASIVIGNKPLATPAEWPGIWDNTSKKELLWVIPSDASLRPGFPNNGPTAAYRVSNAMSDIVFSSAGGIRNANSAIRKNQAGVGQISRTLMFKYEGTKNFNVFRTAEMYLIRAEAKFRTGDVTALDDLNELREQRGVAEGTETGTDLFNAIILERRIELLGEGHRWFDIKRTTKTVTKPECGTADGSLQNICTVASDSRSWIWPIPITQIILNPNLAQNPGY
jgi:hypothetical protein